MYQVPLSVVLAWMMGIPMDLDFNFIETGSLLLSVLLTAFALQVFNNVAINREYSQVEFFFLTDDIFLQDIKMFTFE